MHFFSLPRYRFRAWTIPSFLLLNTSAAPASEAEALADLVGVDAVIIVFVDRVLRLLSGQLVGQDSENEVEKLRGELLVGALDDKQGRSVVAAELQSEGRPTTGKAPEKILPLAAHLLLSMREQLDEPGGPGLSRAAP